MKNVMILGFLAMFVVGFCVVGCEEKSDTSDASGLIDKTKEVASQQLCDKCGQTKGSKLCCVTNAVICPRCGLVKDSPGCLVKMAGGPGISLRK